jgi:hypothetical protein
LVPPNVFLFLLYCAKARVVHRKNKNTFGGTKKDRGEVFLCCVWGEEVWPNFCKDFFCFVDTHSRKHKIQTEHIFLQAAFPIRKAKLIGFFVLWQQKVFCWRTKTGKSIFFGETIQQLFNIYL